MVEIEPFKFQQCTAFKERYQLGNKLNEVIDYLNNGGGSGSSELNFEEVDFATLQEHFNDYKFDKTVIMRLTIYDVDYVFYPNIVYSGSTNPPITFLANFTVSSFDLRLARFTMRTQNNNLIIKETRIEYHNTGGGEFTLYPESNSYIPISNFKFYMAV